jgi:hypothetical protein
LARVLVAVGLSAAAVVGSFAAAQPSSRPAPSVAADPAPANSITAPSDWWW